MIFKKLHEKWCENFIHHFQADASVDMAERHFYMASMDYVVQIQEVHERKKFEFVETLLSFMFSWFTFYHQVRNYQIP